jgi:pilus assembly protein FimV
MTTTNRISAASIVAAASLAFSSPAWSLGLGDVTVESFLNQPLEVRIDLITRETDDLESVSAKLASADDYELIGASRESVPVPIRFTIEDIEGDVYLRGYSKLPIKSPVVRLIVEVDWSSGRLLREYTVFLDPPTTPEPAPIPRIDQRKAPPAAAPARAPEPASTRTPASESAVSSTTPRQPADGEYGPVRSGQTLWGIASNWSRGTGLEINKVMIAIQRENPDAFLRGNINLLKRGAILRMPRVGDVNAITTSSAISEVHAQTEEFRGRKSSELASSPSTPLIAEETAAFEPEQARAEPVEAADSDSPVNIEEEAVESDSRVTAEAAAEPRDQLELVPPSAESDLDSAYGFEESEEGNADTSIAASSLRESLARKEEELITQQQQNEYLSERIRELETQLADAEEATVEDADMANMQDRLREERRAEAAAAPGAEDDKPWYSSITTWLIGLLVLVVVVVGWLLSRRGGGDRIVSELGSEEEQLREIKDEAEDVLRVLEDSDADEHGDDGGDADEESVDEDSTVPQFGTSSDDAEILDEESSDPEIQLDLARAYISMGDKEAARVILEEVGSNGTEEQRAEAKKMLDLLVP